jgi:hypothetical protein
LIETALLDLALPEQPGLGRTDALGNELIAADAADLARADYATLFEHAEVLGK